MRQANARRDVPAAASGPPFAKLNSIIPGPFTAIASGANVQLIYSASSGEATWISSDLTSLTPKVSGYFYIALAVAASTGGLTSFDVHCFIRKNGVELVRMSWLAGLTDSGVTVGTASGIFYFTSGDVLTAYWRHENTGNTMDLTTGLGGGNTFDLRMMGK